MAAVHVINRPTPGSARVKLSHKIENRVLSLHPTFSYPDMSTTTFSSAHRIYVKSLYKRKLTNALDWTVRRDIWRAQAMQIRAEFEQNRCATTSLLTLVVLFTSYFKKCARPTSIGCHFGKGRGRVGRQKAPRSLYL